MVRTVQQRQRRGRRGRGERWGGRFRANGRPNRTNGGLRSGVRCALFVFCVALCTEVYSGFVWRVRTKCRIRGNEELPVILLVPAPGKFVSVRGGGSLMHFCFVRVEEITTMAGVSVMVAVRPLPLVAAAGGGLTKHRAPSRRAKKKQTFARRYAK